MTTLTAIVESIMKQIKPHLTDDVDISELWIKEVIHQSRAALINKKFLSGELFNNFYQELEITTTLLTGITIGDLHMPFDNVYAVSEIPVLLHKAGKRAIDYFGNIGMSTKHIDYVEFNEFIAYDMHRFGSTETCYTVRSNKVMIRNANGQEKWLMRALFAVPTDVIGYDEDTDRYPIDDSDLHSLEIITFQHIAPKLGMPIDLLNNASDATKNAPVTHQVKQSEQNEEQ